MRSHQGRRGLVLVALAVLLGGLAASDVAHQRAQVERELGPLVDVVVARETLPAGVEVALEQLRVRRVPERFAPAGAIAAPAALAGARLAAGVERGGYVTSGLLALEGAGAGAGPGVRPGERALELLAAANPDLVTPGARVDVLVTRDGGSGSGATELALQDVEVLDARGADEGEVPRDTAGPRVAATLRVTLRDAVYLSAAQAFAREVRLLPRAPGDRGRARAISVGEGLR